MDYTLGYHIIATLGYLLVAAMAFTTGWILRDRKTKRSVKEIDGFALYKLAIMKREKAEMQKHADIKEQRRQQTFRVFKG